MNIFKLKMGEIINIHKMKRILPLSKVALFNVTGDGTTIYIIERIGR